MKTYKIGYMQGVYDLFHIGHLNLIRNAKTYCEYLNVGVNSDILVQSYKNKKPIIPENERCEIISALKYVDFAFIVNDGLITVNQIEKYVYNKYNVVFTSQEWKNSERFITTEKALKIAGIDVVYLPYTDGISSTMIRESLLNNKEEK